MDMEIFVTILILIDGFLQSLKTTQKLKTRAVTILILIDGFLQLVAHDRRNNT